MSATGAIVAVAAVLVALALGALWRARQGRIRTSRGRTGEAHTRTTSLPAEISALLAGDGITLVQISTTYCAPCRQARAVLGRLAAEAPGISHAELDVTNLPSVVGELRVLSTPTTIAYDPNGVELLRISGVPRAGELRTALQRHPVSG